MQITVTFKKDRIRLPIATFAVVQGLLYQAMNEDPQFATRMHEAGRCAEGRQFKLFSFSELKGVYRIEGHSITFLSEARMTVRSIDPYLIQLLFAYFSSHKAVELGAQMVEVDGVRLEDPHIYDSEILVRTLSPVTVYRTEENGHTTYFSPKDPAFYSGIINNARRKWISWYGTEEGFALQITPAPDMREKKCATRFKETFISGWHGRFVLQAPPRVLNFLYQTGLGSKNSQGFGMIEYISEKQARDLQTGGGCV